MNNNIVKQKSFDFAVRIVKLYQFLTETKKECIMSKQILRCGTSVGANVREAEHAESRKNFTHKLAIAQKEINETIYWLKLLNKTEYFSTDQSDNISLDSIEIRKLLTSILKSSKEISLIINN